MVLRKGSFGLGASSDFLRKRNHLLRTISAQPTPSAPAVAPPATSPSGRPERTQSQSDGERRERLERAPDQGPGLGPGGRSMSITANCWGRSKMEPALFNPK